MTTTPAAPPRAGASTSSPDPGRAIVSTAEDLQPETQLELARRYTTRGWRPFPVEYGGKRPAVGVRWGTATATEPTEKTLNLWFGRDPVNIGIAAKGSGLVILDEDTDGGMERLCDDYGQAVPDTYRVRTAKGWHWYFDAPDQVEIGNAPGLLADYGFDVRGGRGDGGYVVAAGSVHESGHIYTAETSDAHTVELPWWLVELLLPEPDHGQTDSPEQGDTPPSHQNRRYTHDQAVEWVERYAVGPLKAATEGNRNDRLNTAACVVGHFVPQFWPEDWAVERLTELAEQVGLDDTEILPTIRSGLRAGQREPYTPVERDPFAAGSCDATTPDPFELEVATELHKLQVRAEAQRRLAAQRRADRPPIADSVLDDLDAIEPPPMLLGSLIPDRAVGFLAGRSGAYKSFLATAWACCIATGTPWLGRSGFTVSRPLKTLYVAAEGAAGAAGRIKAWEASTGISRRGKLLLYPRAIHLNDPAQVAELTEYIVDHQIEFLVIDTYHRSAPGTEENSATDFGAVFEAVATLRDNHGCATLFVDHTGAGKAGNPRGTSAKRDDADYVLSVSYLGEEAGPEAQRELWVTKLKDVDTEGRWPIRLTDVEGEQFPVVEIGATEVATAFGATRGLSQWWTVERCPEIPAEVDEAISKATESRRGAGRDAARWAWRLLAHLGDEAGQTGAAIRRMLKPVPACRDMSEETVTRGLAALVTADLIYREGARYVLDRHPL